jgi:hypothetical protein
LLANVGLNEASSRQDYAHFEMFMGHDTFEINGENFENSDGFIREFNRIFISQLDAEWHGNLDAFNDYLSLDLA